MNNVVKYLLLPVYMICFFTSTIFAEDKNPLNTLDAINHAVVSIYRVERNPSKVTVDEEYNDIINNVAWGNITADQELLNLFSDMMNAYTENRLDAKDRDMLRKQYETQVNRAFLEVKPLAHIQTEAAVAGARAVTSSLDGDKSIWRNLLNASVAGATAFGDYQIALQANERIRQQAKGAEQEFMQQRMAGEWELDKAKIRRFNQLKTSLLNAAWPLLNRYNLPDEARITESNLDSFYNFISEKDIQKAIRMGKRLESTFAQYAPFWFHLGAFYLDSGNVQQARKCFEKFEEVNRPIQRKDTYAAANARYKIFTLDKTETAEAKRMLGIIEKQSLNSDWNNLLFAALQNYQLGNKEKAEELLIQNIDNGYDVPLNEEILRQIQKENIDIKLLKYILAREYKELNLLNLDLEQTSKQIRELTNKAENGDLSAQTYLGACYMTGENVEKNVDIGFYWLNKASRSGHPKALLNLARAYYNGHGVKKNIQKSFSLTLEAANKGDPEAQYYVGYFYSLGDGIPHDLDNAIFWYKKAASQGHEEAKKNLEKLNK